MATLLKQNKGQKSKGMRDPHPVADKRAAPTAGSCAVKIHGTSVHAAVREHITRPSSGNAGSHDSKVREHGGQTHHSGRS